MHKPFGVKTCTSLLLLVVALMLGLLASTAPISAQGPTPTPEQPFAPFNPGKVDTSGAVVAYTVAPDFGNVVLSDVLTENQREYLLKNAFVVSPGSELEFYTVYEKARYAYQPLFITTDSLLHSFHLVFDKVLRGAETEYFHPLLISMNKKVLSQAEKLYTSLKGTDWEDAARRSVAYLAVASKLADPTATVPASVNDLAQPDLANIQAAAGIGPSVIFPKLPQGEDWSQYKPRGHYTRTEELSDYFRAMMYYGRMTFRLSQPEETKSALLVALAVRDANALKDWDNLYAPTVFFVGKSDSLGIPQYLQVMDQVYGAKASAKTIQTKGVDPFVTAAQALPAPRILNMVIADTDNIEKETKGMRFMGQRFVWDAYVFRNLVYRNVGTRDNPRPLPMALDVFAALGSERALQILDQAGATKFENYSTQLKKVQDEVSKVSDSEWTETLYNAWLYSFNTLAQPVPQGYPSFMTNQAYLDRSLYAALGSFAELKHDTILYAQQSYAEMGGGGGKSPAPEPVAPPNYVEPVPLFWARLAALAEMGYAGLNDRKLLNETDGATLKQIAELARHFESDAVKELHNQALTADEQNELRFYGGTLETIYKNSVDTDKSQGPLTASALADLKPRVALVSDIATDPNSQQVVEVGTGDVYNMYAVVPVDGKLWLALGAVYSYYEFNQPLSNRLTDEQWWKMIDDGKTPPIPAWTSSFMSKDTVEADLVAGVRNFQSNMTNTLWYQPTEDYKGLSKDDSPYAKFMLSQLEPLVKANQYEGRQIIETNYRSFDMKDATTAIVTTRETWRGELHDNNPSDPYSDGPKVAERGPYTIDVTYTLKKGDYGWEVTNVVVNGTLPEWVKSK